MKFNNLFVSDIFLFVGMIIFLVPTNVSSKEYVSTYYTWTTVEGILSFTNDEKRVPVRYQESFQTESYAEIPTQLTKLSIPATERIVKIKQTLTRVQELAKVLSEVSVSPPDCSGIVTITRKRQGHEEQDNYYNSLFYIVRDTCGNIQSKSRQLPIPYYQVP